MVLAVHEQSFEFNPGILLMSEGSLLTAIAYTEEDFDAVIDAKARGIYDTTGWVQDITLDLVDTTMHDLRAGRGSKFLAHFGD